MNKGQRHISDDGLLTTDYKDKERQLAPIRKKRQWKMNFLSRDFLYHRGLSKTTYRGTWNRSNVWRLGSLWLGFQPYFAPNRRRPDHRQYCRIQNGTALRLDKNYGTGLKIREKFSLEGFGFWELRFWNCFVFRYSNFEIESRFVSDFVLRI